MCELFLFCSSSSVAIVRIKMGSHYVTILVQCDLWIHFILPPNHYKFLNFVPSLIESTYMYMHMYFDYFQIGRCTSCLAGFLHKIITHNMVGARQNDVNYANMCRFAGNSTTLPGACVWSLDTYFNQSPIYRLQTCFICQHFIPRKILSSNIISCNFIELLRGYFNHGSLIVHIVLSGTSKVVKLSVFLLGTCFRVVLSACQAHNDIYSI